MIKRILVIDDDEAVRKVFLLALEETQFQVDTAPSGEKGMEMVGEQSYDLVYLDLKMPGLSGMDTLNQLRKINPDVPVYIITAYYGEYAEQLNQAKKTGLKFELMMKPLTMDQIVSLTRGILDGAVVY
jgi:DNA-binding NtrC family response regulator